MGQNVESMSEKQMGARLYEAYASRVTVSDGSPSGSSREETSARTWPPEHDLAQQSCSREADPTGGGAEMGLMNLGHWGQLLNAGPARGVSLGWWKPF